MRWTIAAVALGSGLVSAPAAAITHAPPGGPASVLALSFTREGRPICSATLLAPNAILTAAHCVMPAFSNLFARTSNGTTVRIIHRWVATDFVSEGDTNDIAVAQTDEPIDGPLFRIDDQDPAIDSLLRVAGWGDDGTGQRLAHAGTARIDKIGPNRIWLSSAPSLPCSGDSGGPAYMETSSGLALVAIHVAGNGACSGPAIEIPLSPHRLFVEETLGRCTTAGAFSQTPLVLVPLGLLLVWYVRRRHHAATRKPSS